MSGSYAPANVTPPFTAFLSSKDGRDVIPVGQGFENEVTHDGVRPRQARFRQTR
jgi:hypothetical protein